MKVGLLGFGTVGSGVYEIINNKKKLLNIEIIKILDRKIGLNSLITDNPDEILENKEIDTVVEVLGGLSPAYEYIKRALNNGKNVVTANKAVVAKYLDEFLMLAQKNKVKFLFEASVGGGIPWLASVQKARRIDDIDRISGIFNGTSNYILDVMTKEKKQFLEVLKVAQELGYAEADPSADIDGYDVSNKVVISSALAFDTYIDREKFPVFSMRNITLDDIEYLEKANKGVKYIGECTVKDGNYEAFVMLNIFDRCSQEANVPNNFNLVTLFGESIGELKFYGQGAGKLPTANAIVQDVLDIKLRWNNYEINLDKEMIYSDELFKNNYLIRSESTIEDKVIDRVEINKGKKYYYTKSITTKELRRVLEKNQDDKYVVMKING